MTDKIGKKFDAGKLRFDLVPPLAERETVAVLTYGAAKYGPENWRDVPDAKSRYRAALGRHLNAWDAGELLDPETGRPHLAHADCCVRFLLELEVLEQTKPKSVTRKILDWFKPRSSQDALLHSELKEQTSVDAPWSSEPLFQIEETQDLPNSQDMPVCASCGLLNHPVGLDGRCASCTERKLHGR